MGKFRPAFHGEALGERQGRDVPRLPLIESYRTDSIPSRRNPKTKPTASKDVLFHFHETGPDSEANQSRHVMNVQALS